MTKITDISHHTMVQYKDTCANQTQVRKLKNGDLLAVFNQERYPFHHDTGQTVMTRSKDGGITWSEPTVVVPWSQTTGSWDCGICELNDGTLIINFNICGFFKRGMKPNQPSWANQPITNEWGDWTWTFKTLGWLGTYVIKSKDGGSTWSDPIPVNVRPLKHGGVRSGCWQLPNGGILMGLYGRIRGYEEEGEGESTRSALMRSDDGGDNWEYYSTLAYDPASIIDYEEPALLRLRDGRLVCFMRTHRNPTSDAHNMVIVVSDDDGFSWSPPKWTNIWGYPADLIELIDGRYLVVYGYRRPPYGTRGVISEDGINWDVKNEFIIREGGIPGVVIKDRPSSSLGGDAGLLQNSGSIDIDHPGVFQHIGYPTVAQNDDGTIAACYHEWNDDANPLQILKCTRFKI
jgi:sialidase-1